jgi:hypothetical protein
VPSDRPASGQASAEYAAVLALVAAALAGAGAVLGLGGVGEAVASGVRTGICIVGGDVCRASDAEAAGLAPCTVAERTHGGGATLTIVSIRLGSSGEWTVASRSDGSVVVTRADERSAGVAAGIGAEASPFALRFGVKGTYDFTIATGEAWELPDAAAAARLLAADDGDRPPPTWRFGDLGAELRGKVGATVGGAMLTGVESTATAALGARIGRGRTTLYVRARLDGPAASVWLPGGGARLPAPGTGDVLVELTREGGELREMAFRTAGRGGRPDEMVETVGRLDLRVPANRAVAERLLRWRLPWPPSVVGDLRAVALRTVQAGVVERAVYAVRDDSSDFEVAARLGFELGIQADRVHVQRRLVAASAWTEGSNERERVDCLTRR